MTELDLHAIANARGYGSGKAARDRAAAEAECLALLPDPRDLPSFVASGELMHTHQLPLCHFGYSTDEDRDWSIYRDAVTEAGAIGDDAKDDARVVAAILNAYRMGLLVRKGAK